MWSERDIDRESDMDWKKYPLNLRITSGLKVQFNHTTIWFWSSTGQTKATAAPKYYLNLDYMMNYISLAYT